MYNYSKYLSRFDNYKWQLRALSTKETELRKINSDINSGVAARDVFDPDWRKTLQSDIDSLKSELSETERLLTLFPDTSEYIQCKLFFHLSQKLWQLKNKIFLSVMNHCAQERRCETE